MKLMSDSRFQAPRDAVSDIYRAFLRRDPDPDGMAHYTAMLGQQGLRRVVEAFLVSEEFRALSPRGPSPELNWRPKMPIQLDLSDTQMGQLWDHVSQVWTRLGSTDPFWSVLT